MLVGVSVAILFELELVIIVLLSVGFPSFLMLSVVMLSVVMLNVVAPKNIYEDKPFETRKIDNVSISCQKQQ
jgi:hypothetical protein